MNSARVSVQWYSFESGVHRGCSSVHWGGDRHHGVEQYLWIRHMVLRVKS